MEQIQSLPEAKLLLTSLRSVGYSEETAIADIIDNCISAKATEINVIFNWENQSVSIIDNGIGMTADALIKNMRIGSADPHDVRDSDDLGRFGMGMKTASFSLGKSLTVISKANNQVCNATWDLDYISDIGWNLIIHDKNKYSGIYPILSNQGTIIIIEKLDRLITDTSTKSKNRFYSVIRKVHNHLALTFHRFIEEDGLIIRINGCKVDAWNPFVLENRATQELPEEVSFAPDGTNEVLIQPYVLPHKTKFSTPEDYKQAGGYKGWNYHQGIYVYRNKRLIIFGTWFDFCKKEPAYNLARIKVDINSESDDIWKIDIKKSTAALPEFIYDTLERVVENCIETSARVYNSRGTYSKNPATPNLSYVWEQRKRNGRYSFHINRKHILLSEINKQLNDSGKNILGAYLSLVENFAPFMLSGVTDSMQQNSAVAQTNSIEYSMEINELKKHMRLFKEQGFSKEEIKNTFLEMPHYRHLRTEILEYLEEL